ncbi:alpha/beta hydrolase [Streptomyces malaysiensis]|uniref:alpha/beta hydrolase n=1 Tax=Streptomyces malaysiensis TaxID=92644 RepID=UPI002B2AED29|nr:alpha/beta hydrolase [Streptomyces malaysiensis]
MALSVAALLGLTGTTAAAPRSSSAPVPKIDWQSCGELKLADFQCATVEVPTDYDNPDGETTTIALTRLPATNPERRIGSLFTNPGGPGYSGVEFVQAAGKIAYQPSVREHFDIIGFDPRGVGASDPVTCFANAEEEAAALARMPQFPVTSAEEKRFTRDMLAFARSCMKRSGDRIVHASSANVARDMDLLRAAVGDKKLTFAGYSYGTFLGATYAKLFPHNVRALVLDGTLEPESYSGYNGDPRPVVARIGSGPAASRTYGEFLRLCKAAGPDQCALAGLGDPRTVMEHTLERLKSEPVTIDPPDEPPVKITYSDAVVQLFLGLYFPSEWPALAETFATLATPSHTRKEATAVSKYLSTLRRSEDYPSDGAALGPMCVDTLNTFRPRDLPALAAAEDAKAPHFGRLRAWGGLPCAVIGNEDDDAHLGDWEQTVDKPVLVIGSRFDPATPYEATRPFADKFPNARVATLEGWAHGGSFLQGKCMDSLVTRYLVELKATDGASCKPDVLPFTKQAAERFPEHALLAPAP